MDPRRLLGGFAVLAGGTLVTQLLGFVALAIAARRLGPTDLGAANFALIIALYFAIPANFGVAILGIREISNAPERTEQVAREVISLRVGLSIVCFGALVALSPVLAADGRTRHLLPIAAATFLVGALDGEWLLQGAQRMPLVAAARFVGQGVYALAVILFVSSGLDGAELFVWFTVASLAVTALISQTLAWRGRPGRTGISVDLAALRRRFITGLPFGVAVVMVQIYFSIDAVMLGYLAGPAAVGQYAVAYKIPLALYGVVNLWAATLFSQAARLIESDRAALRAQVGAFTTLGLALALPLGAGAIVLGRDAIPELFGGAFRPAGTPFILLMWALAIAVVTVNFTAVLAAVGDERRYALGVALGALLNVLINVWAIPAFGTIGAAAATIAAELVLVTYMLRRYRHVVGGIEVDAERLLRAAGATAAMVLMLVLVGGAVSPAVRIALGSAVYLGAAVGLGALRWSDLRSLVPARS